MTDIDIVERLREVAEMYAANSGMGDLEREAADEIERLRQRVADAEALAALQTAALNDLTDAAQEHIRR